MVYDRWLSHYNRLRRTFIKLLNTFCDFYDYRVFSGLPCFKVNMIYSQTSSHGFCYIFLRISWMYAFQTLNMNLHQKLSEVIDHFRIIY